MTFAEKARKEHPEACNLELGYPASDCPHHYGFEKGPAPGVCSTLSCRQCWNREIPEEPVDEAKPTTTKKTKAQLLEEISNLKEEVARLERYSQYKQCADELYALYEAFKNAGFEADKAFDLTRATYENSFNNQKSLTPKR